MNLFHLLSDVSTESSSSGSRSSNGWMTWVFLGIIVVAFVLMFVFQGRRQKKQQAEQDAVMNALRPGNKVKTIGGVCGIVVEVNPEENTFVMETGNELNGKCYLKFDRQAIYQTDAKVEEKKDDKKDSDSSEEPKLVEEKSGAEVEEKPQEKVSDISSYADKFKKPADEE